MVPTRLAEPFTRSAIGMYQTKTAVPMPSRPRTAYIVIHHAAWDYAPGDACRAIFAYHSGKWPQYGRIGYHEVLQIEPDGSLRAYLVNPPDQQGAGVANRNHECYHICAATNFGAAIPLQLWQDALALRVAAALARYPAATVVGHTEIALPGYATACPGAAWRAWKPALLARARAIGRPTPADPFAAWGPIDKPAGAALGWAIPQTWLKHQELGRCLLGEFYLTGVPVSVACFQYGAIVYDATRKHAHVVPFGSPES